VASVLAVSFETEGTAAATILERQWFMAYQRVESLRTDCEILREVMEVAQANWRDATARLTRMEALCDALGEEFTHSSAEYFYSRG
jgi:hypothetical protein